MPADDSEHEAIEIPQNVAQSIANLVVKSDKPIHCCLQCEEKFTLGAALMKHSFAVHRIEGATKPMDLVSYVIKKTGNNYYRCVVCQEQKFLLQKLLVHAGSHITKKSTNHPQSMLLSCLIKCAFSIFFLDSILLFGFHIRSSSSLN